MMPKPTILIVDDMTTNLLLLSDILKDDYKIKIAKNGYTALEIANGSDEIDLILLDIEMPDINGYEVCKELKSSDKTKNIPIMFVTARSNEADEEYGLNLGAVDYIIKPYAKPVLKARIKNQIHLKQKTDLLEQLSMYDGLTNIKNRRFFDESFDKAYLNSKRDKTDIAIMMIDVDFFKLYNDNYGHGKGDVALQQVAYALKSTLKRPKDLVARYGGEEFVVLLEDIDEKGLQTVAKNLLQNIQSLAIEHKYSPTSDILTVSVGVAFYSSKEDVPKLKILMSADEALYKVKNSGKNNYLISYI
ncbi:MAG: diguanylate cyclase [Arcobacteraceae bacterium]|jgi:diguanylate cyclase (GGDEF)-like protein|nr:diguanylate cyclase [Arcobacteraceae bacterium]MDY0364531.1 diguanylate cyclase [Arcobacteraceae bacterium]